MARSPMLSYTLDAANRSTGFLPPVQTIVARLAQRSAVGGRIEPARRARNDQVMTFQFLESFPPQR